MIGNVENIPLQIKDGEGGIRTLGTALRSVQQISNLPLSTTQPPLQIVTGDDYSMPLELDLSRKLLLKQKRYFFRFKVNDPVNVMMFKVLSE